MLHIVTQLHLIEDAARYALDKDCLLLVEEAVYAVNPQHKAHKLLPKEVTIKVLSADLIARGLESACAKNIDSVDFSGFVDLTAEHSKSLTW
ncbi:hypothetical protein A9264_03540 [Vibrio sp. UCD-FRSSP16_10]|uniref:sulfurtransferase complex subunit TusB n=1 Tax=unclassified Vibrio TaxID=2614977 RepID=UPI0008009A60|nr:MULTISPECIES: sulfurtransferase complex subunit TusB [unclassified Vibrio]OBT10044.1 hypothetical protein A9260_04990 [Vibrio sp. UCD-FRSSP16_30]OBT18834.1 hypothetical protein A9264_03540 [Vibrio sp. UCD-FRSSP16_10]